MHPRTPVGASDPPGQRCILHPLRHMRPTLRRVATDGTGVLGPLDGGRVRTASERSGGDGNRRGVTAAAAAAAVAAGDRGHL